MTKQQHILRVTYILAMNTIQQCYKKNTNLGWYIGAVVNISD